MLNKGIVSLSEGKQKKLKFWTIQKYSGMPISVFVIVYFFKMKEGNMESVPSDYLDPDFRELCEEII